MKEPVKEIVAEITEAVKESKEFLSKLTGFAGEVGLLAQDTVKSWRFRNQVNILIKTRDFISKKNIDPRGVSLKVLVPLLENGSLEEEEDMQNRWVALLANAANPEFKEEIRPSFIEILKELSPIEALILDTIVDIINKESISGEIWSSRGVAGFDIEIEFNLSNIEFEAAIDNLYRLRLCQPPSTGLNFVDKKNHKFQLQSKDIICITGFGHLFVKACCLN